MIDGRGNFIFIDQRNQRIRAISDFLGQREDGLITTIAGTGEKGFNGDGPGLSTRVAFPDGGNPEPSGGMALGADGSLYFADTHNHRIRRIEFSGETLSDNMVTTVAGIGEPGFSGDGGPASEAAINFPQDMEIGPDGRLYFADTDNHRVRRIDLADGTHRDRGRQRRERVPRGRRAGPRRRLQPPLRNRLRRRGGRCTFPIPSTDASAR